MSDLQEEGKNAINAPMNPSAVDIHPEDTLLGKVLVLQRFFTAECRFPQLELRGLEVTIEKRLHVTCRLEI